MVTGINGNVSSLQMLTATQAFKRANQPRFNQVEEQTPDIKDKVELSENCRLQSSGTVNPAGNQNKAYINEVKQFMNGSVNLSDDEINYAIKYGRSILVDQRA